MNVAGHECGGSWIREGNLDRAMGQSTPSDVNMQLICNHEE
jgi:hypothetical protein